MADVPLCPNHGEPLQLDNEDRTKTKGNSPCPISGVLYAWKQSAEDTTETMDKYGNITQHKAFVVDGP